MNHHFTKLRLSELGDIARGVTYKSPDDLRPEGSPRTVRLLRATNIQDGAITLDDVQVIDESCAHDRQRLATGDIAICIANGSRALVGKAALIDMQNADGYVVGAFCARFRPKSGESADLIAAIFESGEYRGWIDRLLGTTTINNLKPSDIADCPIVLPTTQSARRRLGEILRTSRAMLRHTDALIAAKREQKRGLMQQLLTGKVRFPGFTEPWKTVRLENVADVRFSNVDKHTVPGERHVRLCNYTDVFRNRFLHPDMDFMSASATAREIERFGLQAGDVAITKDSETPDEIGVPALIDRTAPDLVLGYHLALLRADRSKLDPGFLLILMESDLVRAHFQRRASGLTRFALSIGAVADTPILLPPVGEQGKIAKLYRDLTTEESLLREMHASFASQRRGLMERLLSGDIALSSSDTSAA